LLEGGATYEMLETVLGMQRWQVMECVEELDKQGLIVTSAGSLRAGHDLISTRAVEQLMPVLRRSLHVRVAEELERRLRCTPDPRTTWSAAQHFAAGGDLARAVRLSIDASAYLAAVGAQMLAAALLKHALPFASTPDERMLLFDRRRELLIAASAYDEVVTNSREALADVKVSTGDERVHNDHELASLGLRHIPTTIASKTGGTLRDAFSCATAINATTLHRLKAAFLGLASASNDGRADWADRLYGAARSLACHTVDERVYQIKCDILYHTLFGTLSLAVTSADELEALVPDLDLAGQSTAYRVCAYALEFAGQLTAARERFGKSFRAGTDARVPSLGGAALLDTAGTYSFEGEHETAWQYYEQATRLFATTGAPALGTVVTSGAELAFLRGDVATGVALSRSIPALQPLRHKVDKRCLGIFSNLCQGQEIEKSELASARAEFQHMARLGYMDFSAGTIARAIGEKDVAEAREFVLSYLEQRRERCPIGNPFVLEYARS